MSDHAVFQGTKNYLTSPELRDSVNVAIALQKPLLIKGEPGTGKTLLAEAIAEGLEMDLLTWHVKSTTKAWRSIEGMKRLHYRGPTQGPAKREH